MDTAITTTGAGSAPAAPITAADQTRIDDALRDARAANTRAQYRSAWRGWAAWCADHGHEAMPADPLAVAAYLAERTERGAADPTAYDGVRSPFSRLAAITWNGSSRLDRSIAWCWACRSTIAKESCGSPDGHLGRRGPSIVAYCPERVGRGAPWRRGVG